jgi:hypothetical protein
MMTSIIIYIITIGIAIAIIIIIIIIISCNNMDVESVSVRIIGYRCSNTIICVATVVVVVGLGVVFKLVYIG